MPVPIDTDRRTPRGRLRLMVLLASLLGVTASASPAFGALNITMFTERDHVEVDGLAAGDVIDIDVTRAGQLVGTVHGVPAVSDGDGGFLVVVNHPGPPDVCWSQSTPDLIAGDIVNVTVTAGPNQGTGEQATIADISVTDPATETAPGVVVVHGLAVGRPLLADLEQRITNAAQSFSSGVSGNGRDIRAPGAGVLAYDAPTGDAWTATYSGLQPSDVDAAVTGESRISHLTGLAGGGLGLTIFELGAAGGPQMPQCPAQLVGPKVQLPPSSDSGSSSSDAITRFATPTFTGVRGGLGTSSTVNLYDGNTLIGTTTLNPLDGSFSVTPTVPLVDGLHAIRAGHPVTGQGDVLGPAIQVRIDTAAPAAPFLAATNPPSPANANAPAVTGSAEAGSLVRVYTNPACGGPAAASVSAAVLAAPGAVMGVKDNSTTSFFASAEDVAGNVSACSTSPLRYREATPAASVTTARVGITTAGRGRLGIRCIGLPGTRCRGRVALVITLPPTSVGKKARKVAAAAVNYNVEGGHTDRRRIVLSRQARKELARRGQLRAALRFAPASGSGVVRGSRTSVLLKPIA